MRARYRGPRWLRRGRLRSCSSCPLVSRQLTQPPVHVPCAQAAVTPEADDGAVGGGSCRLVVCHVVEFPKNAAAARGVAGRAVRHLRALRLNAVAAVGAVIARLVWIARLREAAGARAAVADVAQHRRRADGLDPERGGLGEEVVEVRLGRRCCSDWSSAWRRRRRSGSSSPPPSSNLRSGSCTATSRRRPTARRVMFAFCAVVASSR